MWGAIIFVFVFRAMYFVVDFKRVLDTNRIFRDYRCCSFVGLLDWYLLWNKYIRLIPVVGGRAVCVGKRRNKIPVGLFVPGAIRQVSVTNAFRLSQNEALEQLRMDAVGCPRI